MLKNIKIGCASSKTKYGTRLDSSIVKLEKEAIWSGLFTSNKFKSAPVEICLEKMNKNISKPKILMVNAGNANAATGIVTANAPMKGINTENPTKTDKRAMYCNPNKIKVNWLQLLTCLRK